jgi:hypothetical protein
VRRIIRVAGVEVKGLLEIIDWLDEEIQEYTEHFLEADQNEVREQSKDTAFEFKEAMLAWEQQKDDEESASGAELDLEEGPTGEELLQILDGILASEKVAKTPRKEPVKVGGPKEVLRQAIYASFIAVEICKDVTKTSWYTDCFKKYWELLKLESVQLSNTYGEWGATEIQVQMEWKV